MPFVKFFHHEPMARNTLKAIDMKRKIIIFLNKYGILSCCTLKQYIDRIFENILINLNFKSGDWFQLGFVYIKKYFGRNE